MRVSDVSSDDVESQDICKPRFTLRTRFSSPTNIRRCDVPLAATKVLRFSIEDWGGADIGRLRFPT